jgi:hypothetical protein|tara:strand:+ start:439 stop:573 length:135 start_codon:yes stop_codon:yes gene_type:complete
MYGGTPSLKRKEANVEIIKLIFCKGYLPESLEEYFPRMGCGCNE